MDQDPFQNTYADKWWTEGKGFLYQSYTIGLKQVHRDGLMNSEQICENMFDMFQMLINFLVLKASVSFLWRVGC